MLNFIDTIAVKNGWPTSPFDGVRAFLQVPETRLVIIKPPDNWKEQPDYKPNSRWRARTKWYG